MATDVTVVIPWRPTPDRVWAFNFAHAFWSDLGYQVCTTDTHGRFNLAKARNHGVATAETAGAKVVIVADADTICDAAAVRPAIAEAWANPTVVLPYTEYRSLQLAGTIELRNGTPPVDCQHMPVPVACSGIYVTTPATWWSIGGMDERFTVWAPEDYAFRLAHQTLLGHDEGRIPGHAYALHHEDQPGKATGPEYDQAVAHYQRYLTAHGDAPAMRELVGVGVGRQRPTPAVTR